MAVDTLAPTVGADACVDCACEDCAFVCEDDEEVPLLLERAISFKVLPLLKCMHKQLFFHKKFTKDSYKFSEMFSQEHLEIFLKLQKFLPKISQTGSHWMCQFVY